MTDPQDVVHHRTRPLLCEVGLHRPSYVWSMVDATTYARGRADPERTFRLRVCAACGTQLEGGYWDTAATTALVLSPLLAAAVGLTVGVLSTRRSRR